MKPLRTEIEVVVSSGTDAAVGTAVVSAFRRGPLAACKCLSKPVCDAARAAVAGTVDGLMDDIMKTVSEGVKIDESIFRHAIDKAVRLTDASLEEISLDGV